MENIDIYIQEFVSLIFEKNFKDFDSVSETNTENTDQIRLLQKL